VIAKIDPDVVVAFDYNSVTDHRDHQRAGEAATLAFARAAKPSARLYHWTLVRSVMDRWLAEMKAQGALEEYTDLELGLPDESITTIVDVAHVMDIRRAAIAEHKTQFSPFSGVSPELEHEILAHDHYVRVVPPWNGGPVERSIFG
jgi:N-acetyl-1-D-myo-inositol-2-amino-2-deoxy-alpha-D-glucopyranoside deacetylase